MDSPKRVVNNKLSSGATKSGKMWWYFPLMWIGGFLVFIPLLKNRFIGDDFTALSIYRQFKGQPFLKTILYGGNDFLRPINLAMVMLRGECFGPNPLAFVVANIVLHLINTSMVFLLARRIFAKRLTAIAASLLFLLAFSHYEGITWISSSISMLVTFFMLASIYFHTKFREKDNIRWLIPSILTFILAFLTKETAVSLPFIFLAYDLFMQKKNNRSKLHFIPYLAYAALLAVYLIVQTRWAMNFAGAGSSYRAGWHMLSNIFDYWVWLWMPNPRHPYVAQVLQILPRPLLILYWIAAAAAALSLPLMALFAFMKKLSKPLLWSFLATLLSLAVFMPFAIKISARYAYLPSVFFSMLAGGLFVRLWGFLQKKRRKGWQWAVAVAATLYLIANLTALLMVEREFVKVSMKTEKLALEAGELVELKDNDVLFIENPGSHIHLREAIHWFYNSNVHVHASNDVYANSPKTLDEIKERFKNTDATLYYMGVIDDSLILVSKEKL